MLIDNKTNRYPDSGFNIVTVWDFINEFSGKSSEQVGNMDIVTGYFTIRALSKLYHELPEEDVFRIVSSEMVMQEEDKNHIIDLLNGDMGIETTLNLDEYKSAMKGIYTTSVCEATIDEAPMAYKSLDDIIDVIRESVDIVDIMKPVYNFKAS